MDVLGTMPDPELAKYLGCKTTRVIAKRRALGIPGFRKFKPRA
jgi:hypothetical protein